MYYVFVLVSIGSSVFNGINTSNFHSDVLVLVPDLGTTLPVITLSEKYSTIFSGI